MASSEERRGNQRVGAAYRAGHAGRAAPRSTAGDSFAEAAYQQGVEDREAGRPADERLSALGRTSRGEDTPATSSASTGGKSSSSGTAPGAAAQPARPRDAGGPGPSFPTIKLGGDAGGIMLAIFLYPIVLSAIQHGTAGPGLWLRAKFLNQTTPPYSPPAASGSAGPGKRRPI